MVTDWTAWGQALSGGAVGALIGAVIGAGATLRATRRAIENEERQARDSREIAETSARKGALETLAAELRHIHEMVPTKMGFAHLEMPRDAYVASMRYTNSVPEAIRVEIQRAAYKIDAYNVIARMVNSHMEPEWRAQLEKELVSVSMQARAGAAEALGKLDHLLQSLGE